jgi:hypothetical protein
MVFEGGRDEWTTLNREHVRIMVYGYKAFISREQ